MLIYSKICTCPSLSEHTFYSNVEHIAYVAAKDLRQGYAYRYECSFVPVNLSASGTANCYIVSQPGEYYFNATVAGNGDSGKVNTANHYGFRNGFSPYPASDAYSVSGNGITTIANDQNMIENNCISNVRYSSGNIYFTATGAEGNAKISLTPNANGTGDIQWTWHIWCTDQPSVVLFKNNGTGVDYTVLDRNLGALTSDPSSTDSYGLYYQFGNHNGYTWGDFTDRKDNYGWGMNSSYALNPRKPFVDFNGAKTYYSFRVDSYAITANYSSLLGVLWGAGSSSDSQSGYSLVGSKDGKKTIYDPCPPGYKVIPYDFLYTYTKNNSNSSQRVFYDSNSMWVIAKDGTTKLVFPFNGAAGNTPKDYYNQGEHACIWTSGHSDNCNSWIIWARNGDFGRWGQGDPQKCESTAGMGVRCMAE